MIDRRKKLLRAMCMSAGEGVKRPAAPSEILQWLINSDFDDRVNPQIVDTPQVTGVNCLNLTSTQLVTLGTDNSDICRTGIFTFSFYAKRDADITETIVTGGTDTYAFDFLTSDRVRVLFKNNSNVVFTGGQLISLGVDTMDWHFYEFVGDGAKINISVDGVVKTPITYDGNFDGTANAASTTLGKSSSGFSGRMALLCIDDGTAESFCLPSQEGSGLSQDASGNGNHATASTATWVTDDELNYSYNRDNGFYVAVQGVAPYIPALLDGSGLAANGLSLTNLGGYVHNGFEGDIQQTDADFDIFGADTSFYGDGSSVWDEKTKAQFDTQYNGNGNLNLWLKLDADGNVTEAAQYPLDKVFTVDEAERNLRYFGSGGTAMRDGGGVLILYANGNIQYTI